MKTKISVNFYIGISVLINNLFANLYAIYVLMTDEAVSIILKMVIAFTEEQSQFWSWYNLIFANGKQMIN